MTKAMYEKQKLAPSKTELKIYPDRSHWTCIEPGWEEVADFALDWAVAHARPEQRPLPSRPPDTPRSDTAQLETTGDDHEHDHHQRRHDDLLQGLGHRPADRLLPRLAAQRRRLGCADAVFPEQGLTASSPTIAAATAAPPRPGTATTWTTMPTIWPRLIDALDLQDAVMSAIRPVAARWCAIWAATATSRVAKAAIIGAVPPLMVKTAANPGGLPKEVFDGSASTARRQSRAVLSRPPAGPFYGFNRPGAEPSAGSHPELVATGHDGRCQGALRRHRRLLGDRLHRGPEEDRRAGARHARR